MTPIEAHFFFREKRNGPHPKEKSLSGIVQSTPIPGAVKYCDPCAVLLPGVTPCVCAAFGADQHPSGAPGGNLDSGAPVPRCLPREGAPKGFEFVPKAPPGTAAGGQENNPLFHIVPRRREQREFAPGFGKGLFLWQPETVSFWARPKRNGFGKFADLRCFFYRPFF